MISTLRVSALPALHCFWLAGSGAARSANSVPAPSAVLATVAMPVSPAPKRALAKLRGADSTSIRADCIQVNRKGVNLDNWLIHAFWRMGQGSAGTMPYDVHEGALRSMTSSAPSAPLQ